MGQVAMTAVAGGIPRPSVLPLVCRKLVYSATHRAWPEPGDRGNL